jgi:hypothetical protein
MDQPSTYRVSGSGNECLCTSHITPVRVTNEASVPNSTVLEACSTQISCRRANTKANSAALSALQFCFAGLALHGRME